MMLKQHRKYLPALHHTALQEHYRHCNSATMFKIKRDPKRILIFPLQRKQLGKAYKGEQPQHPTNSAHRSRAGLQGDWSPHICAHCTLTQNSTRAVLLIDSSVCLCTSVLQSPWLHLHQRMYSQPWCCCGGVRLKMGKLFSSHLNGSLVQLLGGNKNSSEKATEPLDPLLQISKSSSAQHHASPNLPLLSTGFSGGTIVSLQPASNNPEGFWAAPLCTAGLCQYPEAQTVLRNKNKTSPTRSFPAALKINGYVQLLST